jgi:hypothetical protein
MVRNPDNIKELPDVAKAIEAMKQGQASGEVEELKSQIRSLEARNAVLQEKITYIAKICETVRNQK